jgi:hypothetical protein
VDVLESDVGCRCSGCISRLTGKFGSFMSCILPDQIDVTVKVNSTFGIQAQSDSCVSAIRNRLGTGVVTPTTLSATLLHPPTIH